MKKIFLFILLFFSTLSVFADTTLKLSSSSEKVNIGEPFQLTFTIESTWSIALWDISIAGIERFNNLWTTQSQNFVIINGETKSSYSYSISLEWTTVWTYEIGPAKITINNEELISNTVQINVWSGKISSSSDDTKDEVLTSTGDTIQELHDVPKWVFQKINFSKLFVYLGLISFFVLFFYILKTFLSKKEVTVIKEAEETKEETPFNEYIKKELLLLKNNMNEYDNKEFFERFNVLVRLYIGNVYSIDGVESKTLSELTSVIAWTPLASLFNESYILEYSSKNPLTLEQKETYIRDFLKFL